MIFKFLLEKNKKLRKNYTNRLILEFNFSEKFLTLRSTSRNSFADKHGFFGKPRSPHSCQHVLWMPPKRFFTFITFEFSQAFMNCFNMLF